MLLPNFNSPIVLWKKLDRVKDCVIVWIVKFRRATHGQGDQWEEGCEIVLIDPTCVVAKFELVKCFVE